MFFAWLILIWGDFMDKDYTKLSKILAVVAVVFLIVFGNFISGSSFDEMLYLIMIPVCAVLIIISGVVLDIKKDIRRLIAEDEKKTDSDSDKSATE